MPNSRILIVDDNLINLKLVSDLLQSSGYEISKAIDAEEALKAIRKAPPDLILMDVGLPGMDGLSFTRHLKADDSTKHIRIVALTAFAMKSDEREAFEAGCDGYISKPIDTRSLPDQVARSLRKTIPS